MSVVPVVRLRNRWPEGAGAESRKGQEEAGAGAGAVLTSGYIAGIGAVGEEFESVLGGYTPVFHDLYICVDMYVDRWVSG